MTNSCYHPVLNPRGTYKTSDNKFWYEASTVSLNSTADCFTQANIGTVNGRPDSKSDKYVYPDQCIDCREFAKLSTKGDEELLRQDKVEWAVEEEVVMYKRFVDTVQSVNVSGKYIYVTDYEDPEDFYGTVVVLNKTTGTNITGYRTVDSGNANAIFFTIDPSPFLSVGNNVDVILIKTSPIISSGESLDVEVLADPSVYSQIMLDRLTAGNNTQLEPNLVDDNGVSNIPDGIKTSFKMNQKMTVNHQVLKSTDSGVTWAVESPTVDYITNTITFGVAPLATDIILVSSTAANKPYHQTAPKPVVSVEPKVIASNDNSIYKGCMITAQVSGKISVGDSAGGLESRVLENVEGLGDYDVLVKAGDAVTIESSKTKILFADLDGYIRTYPADLPGWVVNYPLNSNWEIINTTPDHPTITLNADSTSASKYFKVTEEEDGNLYAGIYGEEITYDGISDWGDTDFSQLTNGTLPDVNGGADIKTFHGSISLNIKRR